MKTVMYGSRRWLVIVGVCSFALAAATCDVTVRGRSKPRAGDGASVLPVAAIGAVKAALDPAKAATVTVYDDGTLLADRVVVFHDASGEVIAETKTDAEGKATAEVSANAMVTVAYGNSVHHLMTVTGVMPGDKLVIGEDEDEGGPGKMVATARVKMPSPLAGARRYSATLGVGATDAAAGAIVPMPVLTRFVDKERKLAVLAEAFDEAGEPMAFSFRRASMSAGASVEKPATDDVTLGAWSREYRSVKLGFAHVPAGVEEVGAELAVVAREMDRFDRGHKTTKLDDRGAASLKFALPRPLGSDVLFKAAIAFAGSTDEAQIVRRTKKLAGDVRIDVAETMLPRVSSARADRQSDVARPVVRWSVSGPATAKTRAADATVVRVSWPETREHVWTVVASPSAPREMRLPSLPDSLRTWRPDARPQRVGVASVSASFFGSYETVKKKGIDVLSEPLEVEEDDTDGTSSVAYAVTGDIAL